MKLNELKQKIDALQAAHGDIEVVVQAKVLDHNSVSQMVQAELGSAGVLHEEGETIKAIISSDDGEAPAV